MALQPTSELEAVNHILATIGKRPVNSLNNQSPDAANAVNTLRACSREIQNYGWAFNTDKNLRLTPNVNGEIIVPVNTLRIDTVGQSVEQDVVLRGTKLYNRYTHSYQFDGPIFVDLVSGLDFTELPEAARRAITVRAGRLYQEQYLGSPALAGFTRRDEEWAMAALKKEESKIGDRNFLNSSWSVARVLDRRPRRRSWV